MPAYHGAAVPRGQHELSEIYRSRIVLVEDPGFRRQRGKKCKTNNYTNAQICFYDL